MKKNSVEIEHLTKMKETTNNFICPFGIPLNSRAATGAVRCAFSHVTQELLCSRVVASEKKRWLNWMHVSSLVSGDRGTFATSQWDCFVMVLVKIEVVFFLVCIKISKEFEKKSHGNLPNNMLDQI